MLIYWIIFFVLFYLSFSKNNNRKTSFLIAASILMFLGATRGSTVGNDMAGGYSLEYKYIHADPSSWGQVMGQFEVGFAWLMGNFKDYVSEDRMLFFHLLFFVTFLLRLYPIKKYSENAALSLFFMFGLGYYFSLYNTMRQELAFSIVGLFLPFILDRGSTWLKWYIIGVIITSVLFHKGLLVMLVLPIINYAKDKKWLSYKIEIFVVLSSFFIGMFGAKFLLSYLSNFAFLFADSNSNFGGYLQYGDLIGSYSNLSNFLQSLFCVYILYLHRNKRSIFLQTYVLGIVLLNMLTPISWIYQRIAYIFMYFSIFVFTDLWQNISDKKTRHQFQLAAILFTLILFNNRLINDHNSDVVPYINYFLK